SLLIPALDIISVEEQYLPLCRRLLHNVFLLQSDDEKALESSLPTENRVILHKSGKFSKNSVGMAGGSVGLFDGKRIRRAKNLENLDMKIKSLSNQFANHQQTLGDDTKQLEGLKRSTQKIRTNELGLQHN